MTFVNGYPTARVRITIEGDYPVRPGDEEAYPGCYTPEECVLQDVAAIQDGSWDLMEMITCLENQADSVEIVDER